MSARRRCAAVLSFAAVGLLGAVGCSSDGPSDGEARLQVDGEVRVTSDGDVRTVGSGTRTLHRGDQVEAVDGIFLLTLPTGAQLEGRTGRDGAEATKVTVADTPELEAGEVLMTAEDGVTVESAGTRVRLEPGGGDEVAGRVARSLAVAATAYTGVITIDSAGQERIVPALRAMEIAALGRPPSDPRPLTYVASDPWDLRYLAPAMELGSMLNNFADGYTGSLEPNEGRTIGFYQLILPALDGEPGFTAELLTPARSQGETLVGAAIASLGRRGTFAERWDAIFGFHEDGAAWGLVALDQAVDRGPLVGTIEQAIASTSFPNLELATGGGSSSSPTTTSTTSPPGGGPTTTSPGTTTTSPTTPPTTEPPPEAGSVPDTGIDIIDDAAEPVDDLIGGLLDPGGG